MKNILYIICLLTLASACNKTNADKLVDATTKSVTDAVDPALAWRSAAPQPGEARPIQLGESTSFELDNGLKVIVVENHKLPRVSYQLSLNHEAIAEGDKAGYLNIAGDLMKTGTSSKSKAEIDEAIDFIGASLSTSARGMFGSSLTKHQDKLLALYSDILYNPSFKEEEFEKLKKQVLSGIASSKTDPNSMASNVASVLNFGANHPYGEVETESTIENIKVEDCKNYYESYYKPNNAYLVVVGDITPVMAKAKVEKYFSSWKRAKVPEMKYRATSPPDETKVSVVNKDGAVQSVIRVTYPLNITLASEDLMAARVMNSVLGGGIFSGRLMQNLREDKAYTYGARSNINPNPLVGSFGAFASVRNEVTDSSVQEFMYELNRMVTTDVSQEDLDLVKSSMSGGFARSLESPQTLARFARNISKYNLPIDYYETYLKRLQAVTVQDVRAAAEKYIKPNNANIVVVGSKDDIAEKLVRFDADGKLDYYDAFGNEVKYDEMPLSDDITAQSVLGDYIAAIGGMDKCKAIKSMHTVSEFEVMGQNAKMDLYQEAPNKMAMKMMMGEMMVQEQVFDGTKLKAGAMGQNKVSTEGDEFDSAKDNATMFPQMYYSEMGYKAELKGTENIDGASAYKLMIESSTGKKKTQFYDVKTSLLLREVQSSEGPQGPMTITNDFADYKEVGGVLIPHTITLSGAMPVPLKMQLSNVEINKPVPAGTFNIE